MIGNRGITVVSIVDREEVLKLENDNKKLKEENRKLKNEISKYKDIGIAQMIEMVHKIEVITEYVEKLEELNIEFGERMNG